MKPSKDHPKKIKQPKNHSRTFAGTLLIAIGIIFFLKMLGIINFSIWQGFRDYWPIGLILVGLALIFRMKWLAVSFLFLTLLFGALYSSPIYSNLYTFIVWCLNGQCVVMSLMI